MKPHIKPTSAQLRLNASLRRMPFYAQTEHLQGTKHSKAWLDYGYPLSLDFWFFYAMYLRVGLAHAVIHRPNAMCWLTDPMIKSGDDVNEDHKELADRIELWSKFSQLDSMQAVGHYAGAFIRVDDGKKPEKPLTGRLDPGKIIDFMPCWEGQLTPGTIDTRPDSERYGLPETYTYHQRGSQNRSQRDGGGSFTIHHSRILIWNEGAAGNTIYGRSRLEPVYNALLDWEKIRGAGGEGFWRQAALRAVLEQVQGGGNPEQKQLDDLTEAIQEMHESMDTIPYLGGMQLNALSTTLSDPKGFAEVTLQDVAAGAGWSSKGLVGAQEGRLAGDADSDNDRITAQSRREREVSRIVRQWLNWLNKYTTMTDKLTVEWDDLLAPSDAAKLDNTVKMAQVENSLAITGRSVFSDEQMQESAGYEADEEIEELPFVDGEGIEEGEFTPSAPDEDVQRDALNGAQIAAIQGIVQAVAAGQMPKGTGIELVLIAYPSIDRAVAEKLFSDLDGFSPRVDDVPTR